MIKFNQKKKDGQMTRIHTEALTLTTPKSYLTLELCKG